MYARRLVPTFVLLTATVTLAAAPAQKVVKKPASNAALKAPEARIKLPQEVATPGNTATCAETTKFTGGAVTSDRTLTKACSPYSITSDISVDGNATLTIGAGVTLLFAPDKGISVGKTSAGKLNAAGTAAQPIVFTSANSSPGPGDWAGVRFENNTMNGTKLGYVKLDYCGGDGFCVRGEYVKPNRVTVDHVVFANVASGADAIFERAQDSNFAITACSFLGISPNRSAISLYAPSFAGIDTTNAFNGARVELKGGKVDGLTTWKNIGTEILVWDDIHVEAIVAPTLTIAAGTVLKFVSDKGIYVGCEGFAGKLVLSGTATSPVRLTSSASSPSPGDWAGLRVCSGQATVSFANISYGGGNISYGGGDGTPSGNLVVDDGATVTVAHSTLSNSAGYGLWLRKGSPAKVTVDSTVKYSNNVAGTMGPGPS